MSIVIVPNYIHNEIHKKITEQLSEHPELEQYREEMYSKIIAYFDEHGVIPDFKIKKSEPRP